MSHGGKGDKPRTESYSSNFRKGYDRIFGSKTFNPSDEDHSTKRSGSSKMGQEPIDDEAESRHQGQEA
jgi:hypothetical protein